MQCIKQITKFDWDNNTQGQILGSVFYGIMIGNLLAGVLAQHFGAKKMLITSLFGQGTLNIFIPLAANKGGMHLVAIRTIYGLFGVSSRTNLFGSFEET